MSISSLLSYNNSGPKFISSTIALGDPKLDALQFQRGENNASSTTGGDKTNSSGNTSSLNQRIVHPINLDSVNDVSYKIKVPNFSDLEPLKLGFKYITDLIKIDSMIPTDLYGDDKLNKVNSSTLDNYYFNFKNGLGEFSKFEKSNQFNLPDKFFDEYNSSELTTKIGMFPEIERAWIIADNKLLLWNYKAPQLSFNKSAQFLTIDNIRNTILTVKLAKPKPGIFVSNINYILLIATPMDIHIYVIKYDSPYLEVFNPNLSVSTQGLIVNNFCVHEKTNDIYFSGEGDGINIWKLEYTNKSSFIKNKCDKVCLTKSGFSSVLPINKISIFNEDQPSSSHQQNSASNNLNSPSSAIPEVITQMEIDSEREILYSLSNKSVIRTYKLQPNQEQFTVFSKITPSEIFKNVSNLFVDSANFKSFLKFRIMNIHPISNKESSTVQLIAVTNYGVRILLKLGLANSISSFFNTSFSSSSASRLKPSVATIRFPPSKELPNLNNELDSFTRSKQYVSQLISNQQKSQLLKNTKFTKVISPGVFLCVKETKTSDKLFVCTTNFGFLKKNNKLIEDAEFIKLLNNDNENTFIHDIIQLTPSMNATNQPNGYANISASQYTKRPLEFAIVTNYGIIIYQFKTSDKILKSLNEELIENFIEENGFEETCSTLLYLSCSYGHRNSNDLFKRKAQILFSTCGNNPRLVANQESSNNTLPQSLNFFNQQSRDTEHPTSDQVILSDRFYGTCLLVSRLFRDYWNSNAFLPLPYIKFNSLGQVDTSSIKEGNLLIKGLNISKKQIEFFMGSVIVLLEFFIENGNTIQGLNAPNYSSDPNRYENEICLRAEHIAFTSILKSLDSMKEALSFLMVLIEETEANQNNFNEILRFLSITNQLNLLKLTFKDLLLPNKEVKNLIKDLLSSIINKNILKGGSIDLIASSLQGRCGSFVSTDDVFIFKAIENLTKAKNIGLRDNDLKMKCLKNAVLLFEEAYETLTFENIENSINIMLELEYYTGAVELLLKLASKLDNNPKKTNTVMVNQLDKSSQVSKEDENRRKKNQLYDVIFNILTKVDLKVIKVTELNDPLKTNEIIEIRDSTYETCFASKDKSFHYEFYQWFISQGANERLLEIDTAFILQFLEDKSANDLELSNLLWSYHAKREHYFNAANILYSLTVSEFKISLVQRLEYLSRAAGFCNCISPPNIRQKMIQLATLVQELFDVGNVQLDILTTIQNDTRINESNKKSAVDQLNYKILSLNELFNDFTDPLGYYDLSLLICKVSDYRNTDDILKRWELFFEKLYHIFIIDNKSKLPMYIIINNALTSIGIRLSSNDLVFPVDKLIKLIFKHLHEVIEDDPLQQPPSGAITDMFIKSGVQYEKLYYVMKSLIENDSFEIYPGFIKNLKQNEMVHLIKNWYNSDKNLRNIVSSDKVVAITEYSVESDPIHNYVNDNHVFL